MKTDDRQSPLYTRRDFGKLALAGVPASLMLANVPLSARASINSKIKDVQIGAITYSFRDMSNGEDVIKAFVQIGLGEMELMSNHCESLAGVPGGRAGGGARAAGGAATAAPAATAAGGAAASAGGQGRGQGGGRATQTPEQQAASAAAAKARTDWKMSATEATFKPVRAKIEAAGIDLAFLCYNMNVRSTTDDDIEYAFTMAKGLGVRAITTSTQVSMAKRLAPFAEKHKMMVGFHGHDSTENPDEVSTEATFQTVMAASKYFGANLDIGHYVVAKGDPIAFIKKYHDRITNLHLKDKKLTGPVVNVPWGTGDTPIKEVLHLMSTEKWPIPTNIEYVHADPDGSIAGVTKCFQFIKDALA